MDGSMELSRFCEGSVYRLAQARLQRQRVCDGATEGAGVAVLVQVVDDYRAAAKMQTYCGGNVERKDSG